MFQVNEMIVYGKHGICKVVAKGKIDMPMIDKNKEYYTLMPCKEKASAPPSAIRDGLSDTSS